MRLLTVEESKLLFYGGPIAIINTIKNNHVIVPINVPMKEFFICESGVYMTDSQTQYRYNKQPLSFYTSHGELIPKGLVKRINSAYQKKDFVEMRKLLELIYPNLVKGVEFHNIYQILYSIADHTKHFAIDLNSEKYLPHMEAYSPQAIKNLYHTGNEACTAIDRLAPPRFPPKLFPIGLALMIGIIALAVIQNLPKYIRELQVELRKSVEEEQAEQLAETGGFLISLKPYIMDLILGVQNVGMF